MYYKCVDYDTTGGIHCSNSSLNSIDTVMDTNILNGSICSDCWFSVHCLNYLVDRVSISVSFLAMQSLNEKKQCLSLHQIYKWFVNNKSNQQSTTYLLCFDIHLT